MNEKRPTYPAGSYTSGGVRLYGLPIQKVGDSVNFSGLEVKKLGANVPTYHRKGDTTALYPGIIFAYAYQGYSYDLDKPKVMLIPKQPTPIDRDESGFAAGSDYHVWEVDRLDHCLAVEVSDGRVEELVLEANKPGRRSPPTYRGDMQIAHRSGRLTE